MPDHDVSRLHDADAALVRRTCLSSALRRADRAVMQLYDEALRPSGLRVTQFSLLLAIRGLEPVSQKELARRMVMEKTTLTRNLAPLRRDGLVRIAPGADRRVRELSLTAKGHRILAHAFPHWRRVQARVEGSLGADRVSQLVADLSATAAEIGET